MSNQNKYWDSVAYSKTFSHPIIFTEFSKYVSLDGHILDYGCGYGRSLKAMNNYGYNHLFGIDYSAEMINRAKSENPVAEYNTNDGFSVPFAAKSFHAVTLLAVLTCIPSSQDQKALLVELNRVLSDDGIIYISDYLLNNDERNKLRYNKYETKFQCYGTFELDEGVTVRHHSKEWLHELFSSFIILWEEDFHVKSMNGNSAISTRIILKKKAL